LKNGKLLSLLNLVGDLMMSFVRLWTRLWEKRSCRTCGTPRKYASALSALVPKLDLGRFVEPEQVRVRGF
jgi:hypothetical protein